MTFTNRLTKPAPKVELEYWEPGTYYLIYGKDGKVNHVETLSSEEEVKKQLDRDYDLKYERYTTQEDHFFRGYFFDNESCGIEDTIQHWEEDFISEEHLNLYHNNNHYGGHLQLVKIEEWEGGYLKTAKVISEEDFEELDEPRVIYP